MNPARRIISEELCYLLVTLLTMGMQSLPVPTDIPMCTASEPAQYQLTFTGKWSRSAFPKQYPVHRPPAQWSNIVGKSTARWVTCGVVDWCYWTFFGYYRRWKPVPVKENKQINKKNLHDAKLGVVSVHVLTSKVMINTISKRSKGWTSFILGELNERLKVGLYFLWKQSPSVHCIIWNSGLYFNFDHQMCWLITRLLQTNTCCNTIFSLLSWA